MDTALNQSGISEAKIREQLPQKLFYTVKETAFLLNVSEKSVRRFLERGLLQSSKALRTKLIPRESVERFVKITV